MMWMKLCAAYNLLCALLHVAFLWLWRESPTWGKLPDSIPTLLDVVNVQIAVVFFLFAYAYFFHGDALRATPLGRTLTIGWLLFWIARLLDDLLFGVQPAWLAFFGVGVLFHTAAAWSGRNHQAGIA